MSHTTSVIPEELEAFISSLKLGEHSTKHGPSVACYHCGVASFIHYRGVAMTVLGEGAGK